MLRRSSLAITLLLSILATLPLATSLAHNLRFQTVASSHNRHHSRAWWRRHRARMRRRLAMIARRRALVAAQNNTVAQTGNSDNHVAIVPALSLPDTSRNGSIATPLPNGWSAGATTKDSSTFRIAAPNGMPAGNATISVVTASPVNASQLIGREQRRAVGGVSFSDLRHSVIDRMISAGGWVVNDREREINGHHVFQVIAQTPASNDGTPEQIWNFYFTEINGRVYSLTTRTAGAFSDQLTADAENFLSSFRPMASPTGGNK